jgi:small subunit ribosomal protein S17
MADNETNENEDVEAVAEEIEEVAEVEAAVEEVVAEEASEVVEAAAEVDEAVEEAVAEGELTPEEGAAIETEVEEAAAETVADEVEAAAEVEGAVEEAAADEVAAETPAPAKRKRKRLPRSQRPVKTRRTREPSAERKAIVRLPKPEAERGRRQERQGTVVSDAMDKTIVVRVELIKAHPRYKKVVRRSVKFHAHDEQNQAKVGDIVRIVETRPLSATKRWRLAEIVEAAK